MPRIYTAQSGYSGTVGNRADANDFGAGIGESISRVGTVLKAADDNKRAIDVDSRFQKFKRDWAEKFQELSENAPADGSGFVDTYEAEFDTFAQSYYDGLDDRGKAALGKKIDGKKTESHIQAISYQSKLSVDYTSEQFAFANNERLNNIANDPAEYFTAHNETMELIDGLQLPEWKKEELRTSSTREMAYAHGMSVLMQRPNISNSDLILQASGYRDELLLGKWDDVLLDEDKRRLLDEADKIINASYALSKSDADEFVKNAIQKNNDGLTPDVNAITDEEFESRALIASEGKPSKFRDMMTDYQSSKMVNNYKRNTKYKSLDDRASYLEKFRAEIEKTDKSDVVDYDAKIKAYNEIIAYNQKLAKELPADPVTYTKDHPAIIGAQSVAEQTGDKSNLIKTMKSVQMQLGLSESQVKYMTNSEADTYVDDLSAMGVDEAYAQLKQSQEEWGSAWPSVKAQLKGLPGWATVATSMSSDRAAEAYISSIKNGDTIDLMKKNLNDVDKTTFNNKIAESIAPYSEAFKHSPSKFTPYRDAVEHIALRHYSSGGNIDSAVSSAIKQVFGLSNVVESSGLQGNFGRVLAPQMVNNKPYSPDDASKHLVRLRELLAQSPNIMFELASNPDRWADVTTANALDIAPMPTFDYPAEYRGIDPKRAAGMFYDNVKSTGEFINVMGGVALSYTTDSGMRDFLSTLKPMPDGSFSREPVVFSWDEISEIGDAQLPLKHYSKISGKWNRSGEILKRAVENVKMLSDTTDPNRALLLPIARWINGNPENESAVAEQPEVKQQGAQSFQPNLERALITLRNHEDISNTPEKIKRADGSVEDFYTGGYGHRMTDAEAAEWMGKQIPVEVMERWWKEDTEKAVAAATKQMKEIGVEDAELFDALVNMNYQLGASWNTIHTNTWSLLKKREFEKAAVEISRNSAGDGPSDWFNQTPTRVEYVASQFRKVSG